MDPGSGHLITFCQFLFIAVHGFIFTSKFGTVKPKIPLKDYLILVSMFFLTSVVNNWAFNFNIPVPLHMIFRAVSIKIRIHRFFLILIYPHPGFVDRKYDHEYFNPKAKIYIFKVSFCCYDNNGYCYLYSNLPQYAEENTGMSNN